MGIDHNPWNPEAVSENDIGGFSSHSSKGDQLLHGPRNHTPELVNKTLAAGLYAFGLIPEESRAPYGLLDALQIRFRESLGIGEPFEKSRCHLIDPCIGALCAQDGRDQKLEGGFVVKRATRIGIGFGKQSNDLINCHLSLLHRGDSIVIVLSPKAGTKGDYRTCIE